jgi:hypothetical protein
MRFTSSLILAVLPASLALPASNLKLSARQTSLTAVTDNLLFSITLAAFTLRRNNLDPPTLDWSSDSCTSSPDNPFGFPFSPACNRHDFGYQNYRIQTRFTESAKLKIDNNFKSDLYNQCATGSASSVCRALADVYYTFVRAFGGDDATPGKRQTDWAAEYEKAVEIYNNLVLEAQANGDLPVL